MFFRAKHLKQHGDQLGKVGGPTLYMPRIISFFNGNFYFSYTKIEPNGNNGGRTNFFKGRLFTSAAKGGTQCFKGGPIFQKRLVPPDHFFP